MSENPPHSPGSSEYTEEIIEFLRDTHPSIVEQWDADIRQSVQDDDPADIWPDYHTADGAEWWIMSEVRVCSQAILASPNTDHTEEYARIFTCEATLILLRGLMKGEVHE